jgi:predicted Zn-dependent peptidase
VLVVAGDVDPKETMAWVKTYFGGIAPSGDIPQPDISEPRQEAEKRSEKLDPLAPQPALAFAWHVPPKNTPEWRAMILLTTILMQGDDSRLHRKLVEEKGYASSVNGGVNWPLGNAYNYNGPMLLSGFLIHDTKFAPDAILGDIDAIVADLQSNLVTTEELGRAKTKLRSALYDTIGDANRIGLVDLLATAALFQDDPRLINSLEAELMSVTPEMIRATAKEYLRTANRSVITLKPGAAKRAPATKTN